MCRRLFPLIMLTLFLSFVLTLPPFSFSLSLTLYSFLSFRPRLPPRARACTSTHTHTRLSEPRERWNCTSVPTGDDDTNQHENVYQPRTDAHRPTSLCRRRRPTTPLLRSTSSQPRDFVFVSVRRSPPLSLFRRTPTRSSRHDTPTGPTSTDHAAPRTSPLSPPRVLSFAVATRFRGFADLVRSR